MKKIYLFQLVLIAWSSSVSSQGCSDAGFCTIGVLKSGEKNDSLYRHAITYSYSYAKGEQSTTIEQHILEGSFSILKSSRLEFKMPFLYSSGNLGKLKGIGDFTININHRLNIGANNSFTLTAGLKFPTGNPDKKNFLANGTSFSYPLPYQPGLGTTDYILGVSYMFSSWNFSIGYQHVLKTNKFNKYRHLPDNNNIPFSNDYFESNYLVRGNDALLRIQKSFAIKKLQFSTGVLLIDRLQKDRITIYAGNQPTAIAVSGSSGITLNVTADIGYKISKMFSLRSSFGTPVIVRDARPDGLTREWVLTTSLLFKLRRP
jgi:hypothetical protein